MTAGRGGGALVPTGENTVGRWVLVARRYQNGGRGWVSHMGGIDATYHVPFASPCPILDEFV